MTFSKSVFTASSLLVMSAIVTTAQECPSDVSQALIASIDNSTYFNTCAKGTTFNVTSVFDVLNFASTDLMTFCNSSMCLEPIHKNMKPLDCKITYMGTPRNLSMEISELHDKCHDVLDEAEGSGHGMSMDMDGNANTPGGSTTVSSDASSIVMMTGSVISAAIVAVFMA